jgi:hypothetical protein
MPDQEARAVTEAIVARIGSEDASLGSMDERRVQAFNRIFSYPVVSAGSIVYKGQEYSGALVSSRIIELPRGQAGKLSPSLLSSAYNGILLPAIKSGMGNPRINESWIEFRTHRSGE